MFELDYRVGESIPNLSEGKAVAAIYSYAIKITCRISNPDEFEAESFTTEKAVRIGVINSNRLGFIVVDFGNKLSFEAPFDLGVRSKSYWPDLELWDKDRTRLKITLIGVDPNNLNTVFGIRHLTVSQKVSDKILDILMSQSKLPTIDKNEFSELTAETYKKFPLFNDIVKNSIIDVAETRNEVMSEFKIPSFF